MKSFSMILKYLFLALSPALPLIILYNSPMIRSLAAAVWYSVIVLLGFAFLYGLISRFLTNSTAKPISLLFAEIWLAWTIGTFFTDFSSGKGINFGSILMPVLFSAIICAVALIPSLIIKAITAYIDNIAFDDNAKIRSTITVGIISAILLVFLIVFGFLYSSLWLLAGFVILFTLVFFALLIKKPIDDTKETKEAGDGSLS